jgi:hypothetical protein
MWHRRREAIGIRPVTFRRGESSLVVIRLQSRHILPRCRPTPLILQPANFLDYVTWLQPGIG